MRNHLTTFYQEVAFFLLPYVSLLPFLFGAMSSCLSGAWWGLNDRSASEQICPRGQGREMTQSVLRGAAHDCPACGFSAFLPVSAVTFYPSLGPGSNVLP